MQPCSRSAANMLVESPQTCTFPHRLLWPIQDDCRGGAHRRDHRGCCFWNGDCALSDPLAPISMQYMSVSVVW